MPFFWKKDYQPISVDIHSHLIPGIDDGAQSLEQSLDLTKKLSSLGVKKIITTPHIHPRYPNTSRDIMLGLKSLQDYLARNNVEMEVEAAAEYYVDETFQKAVQNDEPVLSFGDRYVLIESPFQVKPFFFESTIFDLQSKGYKPVLAHPERYQFLEGSLEWLKELKAMNVLFQLTIGSIGGYYGSMPSKIGTQLLKKGMIDFLGSDLHHVKHIEFFKKGLKDREIQKMIKKGVMKNHELL
ncbi:tyrosine-protein phosphatase [Ekhidna sp.]|uniref:tyrosine-protein phosphatase n=1 Tax=Ekhidna sp. TaxID=2608089 RepID=UPI003CCC4602